MIILRSIRCNNYFNHVFVRCSSSVPKVSTISGVYSSGNVGKVQIQGWVRNVRKMKSLLFVDVYDGSCGKRLQVTVDRVKAPAGLNYGASVTAVGTLQTNRNGQQEIAADEVRVVGDVTAGYPFAVRMPYNPNHEREFIHLRPRTSAFSALLRIRHKCQLLMHNVLDESGFFNVSAPVLTTNDCEGGGEVFTVRPDNPQLIEEISKERSSDGHTQSDDLVFFDAKTYLTVSGQLHLEAAVRSLKKVYSLGPTFRAENSKSRLHLSEFYMLETEQAFVTNIYDITTMLEHFLKTVTDHLLNDYSEEIHQYLKVTNSSGNENQLDVLNKMVTAKFHTVTYDEALAVLDRRADQFTTRPTSGEGFTKEHELYLVEYHDNVPVFIVEWPHASKPFYMKSLPHSDKVEAMDLVCGNVGELCGGGVREDDYDRLRGKIEGGGGFGGKLEWYLELRRHGNVTTAGWGMGFERYLQLLLATPNIKDTIPFPRWPHHCQL